MGKKYEGIKTGMKRTRRKQWHERKGNVE